MTSKEAEAISALAQGVSNSAQHPTETLRLVKALFELAPETTAPLLADLIRRRLGTPTLASLSR